MAPKKIKFQLPQFISEIINHDIRKFHVNKNRLSNIIFETFKYDYKPFVEIADENNISFQFNLNNDNAEIYDINYKEFFNERIETQSELFRSLFYTYISYPSDKREIITYNKIYSDITTAIKERRQINLKFYGKFRLIEPFFISATNEERFNYICCYCHKNEKIVNYRLSKIEKVIISKNKQLNRDEIKITEYRVNFDPYLSYNQKIKIKLTPIGVKLYDKFTFTPKILERVDIDKSDNKIYIIEASDLKAKLFFPQFMDEVEILEPLELREWFKSKIKNMSNIYK